MKNSYVFILFFISMWLGICMLISYCSGWKELAQYYRYQDESILKTKFLLWASMRWVSYKSCLTIGGNAQGLYLSVLFLFAAGSPRLFIPWEDIKIVKKTFWGFPVMSLSFTKAPSVTMMVGQGVGSFLQEVSGRPLIIG